MENFLNYLKELIGKDADVKYVVNGKPVLEIKNGKVVTDEITPKEESKPEEPRPEEPADTPEDEVDCIKITDDVYRDVNSERYYVREKANKQPLTLERVILFDSANENGEINPGVSDRDLAFILLYRNRDNARKYNAIMEFLKADL